MGDQMDNSSVPKIKFMKDFSQGHNCLKIRFFDLQMT